MPDQSDVLLQVLVAEYKELKAEQRTRIDSRDKLMYATMTAVAGVIAAVLTRTGPAGLLLLPPVCLVLGWTYLRNDRHVAHIKAYVRDDLAPQLGELAGGPVLRWEAGPRRLRRSPQVAVELATFAGPTVGALAWYMAASHTHAHHLSPLLIPVWVAEFAAASMFMLSLLFSANDNPGASRG